MKKSQQGLTFIELLMAIAIVGVIAGLAVPSLQAVYEKKRLTRVAEDFYNNVKFAHSESIKRQSNIFVNIKTGSTWCYALDSDSTCDCSQANDCQFDGKSVVVRSTDYPSTSISSAGFSGTGSSPYISFEGVRGTASNSGTLVVNMSSRNVSITTNKLGISETCSNDLNSYKACP